MTSRLSNQVLRIDSPHKEAAKMDRYLVPLYGSPPDEEEQFYYFADSYDDTRERGPLTLQFRSRHIDDILTNKVTQDAVKGALWKALINHLPVNHFPEVTFDEYEDKGPLAAFAPRPMIFGIINLIFPYEHGFNTVRECLKEIKVRSQGDGSKVYTPAATSTLSGRIFIFDCLNLQLDTIDPEALFAALSHMTKHLGQLLGLSKIVVEAKNPKIATATTVRGYLRLSRPWLAVRLVELVYELPNRFVWQGRPHRLLYTGHDLLPRQLNSADYPLKTYGRRAAQANESSPEEESSGGEAASSSRKRKKRREE